MKFDTRIADVLLSGHFLKKNDALGAELEICVGGNSKKLFGRVKN
jgi:hypothetical protein